MFEYWTVTTFPSMKASVVAITLGLRGPSTESARTVCTLGSARRSAGASTSATTAIARIFSLIVLIFFEEVQHVGPHIRIDRSLPQIISKSSSRYQEIGLRRRILF